MQTRIVRYWICQILGWGGWSLLNLFFAYLFAQNYYLQPGERRNIFLAVLAIQFVWYILATHLLRFALKKAKWINYSTNKVIGLFILGVIITGLLSYYGSRTTAFYTGFSRVEFEKMADKKKAIQKEKDKNVYGTTYYLAIKENPKDSVNYSIAHHIKKSTGWYRNKAGEWKYQNQNEGRFWWGITFNFILIALWLLIYMVWHYLLRNQKVEVDKLNLEKAVKELELKTIKSHINPHFIFNSLNSIRALVDENPSRARTSITELSNILRSSLQVEKLEVVPLEKELSIVRDYLALEQMRFEERLKVEMVIDENTLSQPVPPMMLQTLVENTIKHGISRRVNGGIIKIISRLKDNQFELIVQNTGNLKKNATEGFGLKSTRDRLQFLSNGRATFTIQEVEGNIVEAKIIMPQIL